MTITHSSIDFVGALAGALAISIALYLQGIKPHMYSKSYILGLYILGVVLLLLNLEPIVKGTGYWRYIRLLIYLSILIVEVLTFIDLKDGKPQWINKAREHTKGES